MKILLLNGSPKGKNSGTLLIAQAFIEGMKKDGDYEVEQLDIQQLEIKPCLGCFHCWNKTPGECVIKDDMKEGLQKFLAADVIIWSFPLYYFSMPSQIKAFMDRLLPLNTGKMILVDGRAIHPARHNLAKQYVLISSCGFPNLEHNYEALTKQFELVFGPGVTSILCAEGPMLKIKEAAPVVRPYLMKVMNAGMEYAQNKCLGKQTIASLQEVMIPSEMYTKLSSME